MVVHAPPTAAGYTNTSLQKTCACSIRVNITNDFGDNAVYLLYELTNYYQVPCCNAANLSALIEHKK